jgi:hypothetical protein
MNCHIIIYADVDAYMDDDVDAYITISAHLFILWADISKLGQIFFFGPPIRSNISYSPLNLDHL